MLLRQSIISNTFGTTNFFVVRKKKNGTYQTIQSQEYSIDFAVLLPNYCQNAVLCALFDRTFRAIKMTHEIFMFSFVHILELLFVFGILIAVIINLILKFQWLPLECNLRTDHHRNATQIYTHTYTDKQ